jgi:hypothetical protein
MDAFTCYVRYLAIKNHFTKWQYDFFTYRGYVKTTREAFDNRKDKAQFFTLSKKKNPQDILLGHLSSDPKKSVREINQDMDAYYDYQRRVYSMSYLFRTEISEFSSDWSSNFRIAKGQHPPLIKLYLSKRISLETATIALQLSGHSNAWVEAGKDDLLFNEMALMFVKYHSFLRYKKDVFTGIIVDRMSEDDKYIVTASQ